MAKIEIKPTYGFTAERIDDKISIEQFDPMNDPGRIILSLLEAKELRDALDELIAGK